MKFKLEIDLNNAAFADGMESELARILIKAAHELKPNGASLRDINGNRVGRFFFTDDNGKESIL